MKVDQLSSPVEQFTISFVPEGDGAVMKLEWEHTSASVPVKGRMPGAPPPSPPGTAEVALNGKKISVQYSRPSVRGRKIMGGLVPWEKVWRTGANMATGFTTEADLEIGGLVVPKGSYTLFTIPSAKSWQLIVNKQTGQRGGDYDEKQDLGRAEMKVEQLSGPVEQFTISLAPAKGGAVMNLDWENTRASVWLKEKR
ncbi:MAG: DUF2911 domain-containing protein [Acidobacteria bacterium]|nr:DUF2911 domain-containing protein [Acidobacteriota bacterium]